MVICQMEILLDQLNLCETEKNNASKQQQVYKQ